MLGLFSDLTARLPTMGGRSHLLLNATQFNREVMRERIRATRRSIPFCVLTVEIRGRQQRRRRARVLVRLLHRYLRMTDHKGLIGPGKYGVLLVDTPEMGGRCVLDRLAMLCNQNQIPVSIGLRVHDPEGFDPDDDGPTDGSRRHDDEPSARWQRINSDVEVSSEDPLVPKPRVRMAIKRSVDIIGASLGLLAFGPVILAAMAAIRRHDGGPAMFKQTREGMAGRPFTIYKLRTMVVDAEKFQSTLREQSHRDGPAFKMAEDPRVTPIGRLLRKTCVDELPQLWNVLKGDMSLVGPRPLPWHESRACQGWHRRRLEVRPGLTCSWQICKSNVESFDDWMRLDLRYIDELNLVRDLQLIAKTVTVPMRGRGSE